MLTFLKHILKIRKFWRFLGNFLLIFLIFLPNFHFHFYCIVTFKFFDFARTSYPSGKVLLRVHPSPWRRGDMRSEASVDCLIMLFTFSYISYHQDSIVATFCARLWRAQLPHRITRAEKMTWPWVVEFWKKSVAFYHLFGCRLRLWPY